MFVVSFRAHRQAEVRRLGRYGLERMGRCIAFVPIVFVPVAFVLMAVIMIVMRMIVVMTIVVTFVARVSRVMLVAVDVNVAFVAMLVFMVAVIAVIVIMRLMIVRLFGLRRIGIRAFNHGALDAVAMAAAARITMTRAAPVRAVFTFLFGFAVGALIGFDQRLPIRDRDLVVVWMDFAEGQEAMAVAAILDEGRLQRRLYASDLGEVDVAAQLFALGGLEIKLFDAIAADHNDPGLFRVGGVDQHFVGHFGTLGGGGRV
jgi:hypothetical protein